ncbi:MAG TPA: hypothetical protein VFT47_07370 [Vicinamibacterales bacterium]|nr:hypothetical protein [Vicinamibacterales bacterium]
MKRLVFIVCALAILVFPLRAVAQHSHADSPKTTLTVTKPLVVGTTILQPGDYKVQCRTFDGRTFLIVISVHSGKEIARVRCVREELDAPVTDSNHRSVLRDDGKWTLTSVQIKGELVAHRLID